jgi:hypothetical protein
MFQFNVNQDLKDPRMIAATIGAYDSPEAAVSDFDANAPQGKDYLTKQYQRLTGDWFADPFKDAEKAGLTQRIQDAMAGNSFATGGGVPQLLTKFQPMMPMSPVAPVAPVSPIAPVSPVAPASTPATPMDAWSRLFPNVTTVKPEQVQRAAMDAAVKANNRNTQLNSSQLQIPTDAESPNFFNILKQRSSIAGVPRRI